MRGSERPRSYAAAPGARLLLLAVLGAAALFVVTRPAPRSGGEEPAARGVTAVRRAARAPAVDGSVVGGCTPGNGGCVGATLRDDWPAAAPPAPHPDCTAAQVVNQLDWFTLQHTTLQAQGKPRYGPTSCNSNAGWMAALRDLDIDALLACRARAAAAAAAAAGGGGSGSGSDHDAACRIRRRAINVGANKGYLAAALVDFFRPFQAGVNVRTLRRYLAGVATNTHISRCGVCQDCREVAVPVDLAAVHARLGGDDAAGGDETARWLDARAALSVYEVEPTPSNLAILTGFAAFAGADGGGSLLPLQYAVSNASGVGAFPDGGGGDERGSLAALRADASPGYALVNITTVDALMRRHVDPAAQHVLDFLLLDTEGYDPAALAGAAGTLPVTRLLMFEYHFAGLWGGERTLERTVRELAGEGFDCYLAWGDQLVRLTGCWSPKLEIQWWANVLCANRRDAAWAAAVARLATKWQAPVNEPPPPLETYAWEMADSE